MLSTRAPDKREGEEGLLDDNSETFFLFPHKKIILLPLFKNILSEAFLMRITKYFLRWLIKVGGYTFRASNHAIFAFFFRRDQPLNDRICSFWSIFFKSRKDYIVT